MNKEIADKWVAELRSGKHRQARGTMKDCDGRMCCLGVLQEVVLGEPIVKGQCYMDSDVARAAGMRSTQGDRNRGRNLMPGNQEYRDCLAYENDERGKSFADIADIIDAEWEIL